MTDEEVVERVLELVGDAEVEVETGFLVVCFGRYPVEELCEAEDVGRQIA